MMWELPNRIILTSGLGEGSTPLNSFDAALLDAGVGNLNLIKVTSVIPPRAKITKIGNIRDLKIPNGTLTPAVYTYITSNNPIETITAGLVLGIPQSNDMSGLIFESSGIEGLTETKNRCIKMLTEAFKARSINNFRIIFEAKEVVVLKKRFYTVVVVALMLPHEVKKC